MLPGGERVETDPAAVPRRLVLLALLSALVAGAAQPARSAFAPYSNGHLLLSSGSRHDLSLLTLEPAGQTLLPLIPYGADILGHYSPDGTRVAFSSNADGNPEVYVMNADGSGVKQLTDNSAIDWNPSWSPDGKRIAFTSNRDGDFDVYAMDADGSNVTNLTNGWGSTSEDNAHWSPDGRWIAFDSEVYGNWSVWVTDPAGQGRQQVTTGGVSEWFDSWAPDGKAFLVDSNLRGDDDIYRYSFDTNDPAMSFANADRYGPTVVGDDPFSQGAAVYSPDGTKIAFSDNADGHLQVYVMNADGTGVEQLTHGKLDRLVDDWQRTYDVRPPSVRVFAARAKRGSVVTLRYGASDDSGRAAVVGRVYFKEYAVWEKRSPAAIRAAGTTYTFRWRSPRFVAKLRFCAQAIDAYGNASPERCAKLQLVR
jgi:hypothetical protein